MFTDLLVIIGVVSKGRNKARLKKINMKITRTKHMNQADLTLVVSKLKKSVADYGQIYDCHSLTARLKRRRQKQTETVTVWKLHQLLK